MQRMAVAEKLSVPTTADSHYPDDAEAYCVQKILNEAI
jgi:hypothetical protein